jgi:hypothetical protein
MAVDKFVWDHQDFVVVTSVGDQGRTDVSSTVRPRPNENESQQRLACSQGIL